MRKAVTTVSARAETPAATTGPVKIVGTGLLGTSIGLALQAAGVEVWLADSSPIALALARDMGAGQPYDGGEPALVVVAAPPDVTAALVLRELDQHPAAIVTDVASVKALIAQEVVARTGPEQAPRYVGSHPMAGRERSGAAAADVDLFVGRPWVIVPTPQSSATARTVIRNLALDVSAVPLTLDGDSHDQAVALVSHVPQIAASLVAARLTEASPEALSLAGQGIRDVTRIAASAPQLWAAILAGNAGRVAEILRLMRADIDKLLVALDRAANAGPTAPGALSDLVDTIARGNQGVARIPGKHGGAPRRYTTVIVVVPDEPGRLGQLFSAVGDIGVNIEDLHLEHSAGAPVGMAHLSVLPAAAAQLESGLTERGWRVVAE